MAELNRRYQLKDFKYFFMDLDKGMKPDETFDPDGFMPFHPHGRPQPRTPLWQMCRFKKDQPADLDRYVEALLNFGADPNRSFRGGNHPFPVMVPIYNSLANPAPSYPRVLDLLLQFGADVNFNPQILLGAAQGETQTTVEMVQVLLKHRIDYRCQMKKPKGWPKHRVFEPVTPLQRMEQALADPEKWNVKNRSVVEQVRDLLRGADYTPKPRQSRKEAQARRKEALKGMKAYQERVRKELAPPPPPPKPATLPMRVKVSLPVTPPPPKPVTPPPMRVSISLKPAMVAPEPEPEPESPYDVQEGGAYLMYAIQNLGYLEQMSDQVPEKLRTFLSQLVSQLVVKAGQKIPPEVREKIEVPEEFQELLTCSTQFTAMWES